MQKNADTVVFYKGGRKQVDVPVISSVLYMRLSQDFGHRTRRAALEWYKGKARA